MKVFITGANRGIGLEFVRAYLNLNYSVIATVRSIPDISPELSQLCNSDNLRLVELDLRSPITLEFDDDLDLLINNAGIIDRTDSKSVSSETMHEQFQVNTVAPLFLFQKLLKNLLKSKNPRVINITSRVGSIQDNASGGKIAYRTSKASLNMITKTLSVDYPKIIFLALHPGRISTRMVDFKGDMTPQECVALLVPMIENAKLEKSGSFIHRDGYEIVF
jgi:NAD(P)-dependent dehydrogenase (short-subunit alcohol dehydrogenase family)